MIRLCRSQVEEIQAHGVRDFPNECCGVMLGDIEPAGGAEGEGRKIVRELRPLGNTFEPDAAFEALGATTGTAAGEPAEVGRERRYLISPDDMFRLMREERKTGRKVLGFYHSHPNHPAQPSIYDFKASHPGYTYIIVSIRDGVPAEMTAWRQDAAGQAFEPEALETEA